MQTFQKHTSLCRCVYVASNCTKNSRSIRRLQNVYKKRSCELCKTLYQINFKNSNGQEEHVANQLNHNQWVKNRHELHEKSVESASISMTTIL